MTLNSLLIRTLGKGEFVTTTPVIIETRSGLVADLSNSLSREGFGIRHEIPRFNMVSARLPNPLILQLEEDTRVEVIYFDDSVPVPTEEVFDVDGVVPGSLILRAAGLPTVPGAPFRAIGIRPRDVLNQARFAASRVLPAGPPDPGWIPTLAIRQILGADKARRDGVEGKGTQVAALDTGVPAAFLIRRQPQLRGRVERRFMTILPQPDRSGHGTMVITIIGGMPWQAPNGLQLEGVAPEADLLSVKVLQTRFGLGRNSDIIKGLEIAEAWGAKIINMSLGSDTFVADSPFENPFKALVAKEVLLVVAAGNAGPGASTVGTPGGSPWAWTVGAVNTAGGTSGFSSRGPVGGRTKPDLAAPGGDDVTGQVIYTTTSVGSVMDSLGGRRADGIGAAAGTSFAAPAAAGLFALWDEWLRKKRARSLTNADVLKILQTHGTQNNNTGYGIPQFNWVKVL